MQIMEFHMQNMQESMYCKFCIYMHSQFANDTYDCAHTHRDLWSTVTGMQQNQHWCRSTLILELTGHLGLLFNSQLEWQFTTWQLETLQWLPAQNLCTNCHCQASTGKQDTARPVLAGRTQLLFLVQIQMFCWFYEIIGMLNRDARCWSFLLGAKLPRWLWKP